jgi:predicted permease
MTRRADPSVPEPPRGWRRLLRLPERRERAARDVEAEVRFHLEMCEADLVAAGFPRDAAREEARRRFGDPATTAAECVAIEEERRGAARRRDRLAALWQDVAGAARVLRRAPAFTLTAVLTLGVGVGATTAMFGVVDAALLRPLPLPEAGRLVALAPQVAGGTRGGSPGLLAAWGERSRLVPVVAALREQDATLTGTGSAERVTGLAVSGRFFDALALPPALGRAIGPADDVPGAAPVVVLGHRLWTRRFAGEASVLGRTLVLDGVPRTIVGVTPVSLDAVLGRREYLVPLQLAPSQRVNFTPYLALVGRLAPGAAPEAAARELATIVAALGAPARVDGETPGVQVAPLDRTLAADVRRPLLLMLGAVGAVLAIACANVATLVLVRSVGRARELAVRAALGAGRGRLLSQLAAEHVVLGALTALVALPVAAVGTPALAAALVAALPVDVPRLAGASLDGRVLLAGVLLALGTSVAAGIAPALFQRRLDVRGALQAGARGTTDRRGERWRRTLVGAEVALALVLVVGAALLVRSAVALGRVRPGFAVTHVLTARLALPEREYPQVDAVVRTGTRLLEAVRREPGIAGAALVSRVPLGGSRTSVDVALAGRPLDAATRVSAALRITSPEYFRSMGIPLLAGRDLRDADDARAAPVAVVNAALARRLAGADVPVTRLVGQRFRSDNSAFAGADGAPREIEIVGVVGDVRDDGLRGDVAPAFHAPMAQVGDEPWNYWISRELVLVARTTGDAASAAPALRRALARVDGRVPLYDVQTTAERLSGALAVERIGRRLLALLGALGLALAALGIHGVVAYTVAQRTREVGIRVALGASASNAVSVVLRQGLRPVAAGLVVGGVASLAAARAARGLLFGVSPFDPVSLAAAAALLGAAAVVACWAPARRVAQVDPALSLRAE